MWTGMTLREFYAVAEGHAKRSDADLDLLSVHAAWIINCWVKKKVRPHQLTGKRDPRQAYTSGQDAVEDMRRRAESKEEKDDVIPSLVSDDEYEDNGDRPVLFPFDDDGDSDTMTSEG